VRGSQPTVDGGEHFIIIIMFELTSSSSS